MYKASLYESYTKIVTDAYDVCNSYDTDVG